MSIYYTKDHEYLRVEGETAVVGISDYAQGQLGDVVFIDLPDIGKQLAKGSEAAVVESVKAASEIYAPATGEIIAINDALEADPATVNRDPLGEGWLLKLKLDGAPDLQNLMSEADYTAYIDGLD